MAIKILFDDVCEFSQGGVKQLFLSTELLKDPEYYPLDMHLTGNTVYYIDEDITFTKIDIVENVTVKQTRESDSNGKWFLKELKFQIPKISKADSQFLNAFLFKKTIVDNNSVARPTNINNYNTTAIFEDMNGKWWVAGYDIAFKVTAFELTTGSQNGENYYEVTMLSRSYDRIRPIEVTVSECGIVFTGSTTTTTTLEPDCYFYCAGSAVWVDVPPPTTTTTTTTTTTSTTTTTTTSTTTTTTTSTTTTTTATPQYREIELYDCVNCTYYGTASVSDTMVSGKYYFMTSGFIGAWFGAYTATPPNDSLFSFTQYNSCSGMGCL
jgi:hypothetical protein